MAQSYVKITNAEEIYSKGIDKYYIVQIPYSKYCVVSELLNKDKWKTWIMDLMAKQKYLIADDLDDNRLNNLLTNITIEAWNSRRRKSELKLREIIKELKTLIN